MGVTENDKIPLEILLENVLIFCVVWSVGFLIPSEDREAFESLIRDASSQQSLPNENLFECYYEISSGKWTTWKSLVGGLSINANTS